MTAFAFVIILILVVFAGLLAFNFRYKLDWHGGELSEVGTPIIRLGETKQMSYEAKARNSKVLSQLEIDVWLVCEEVVYYQRGTDRVKKSEDLLVLPVNYRQLPSDNSVVLEMDVHVPADAPASMSLKDNNFVWTLKLKLDPASGVDMRVNQLIEVPPVRIVSYEPPPPAVNTWPSELPEPPTPRDEL